MSWHHSVYCAVCFGIIDNDNSRFNYYLLINMNAVMFILEVLYVGTVVGTIIEVALLSQRAKKGKIFIGNWINAFLHLIMIVMLPAALEAIYCHWSTGEPKWTSPSIYIHDWPIVNMNSEQLSRLSSDDLKSRAKIFHRQLNNSRIRIREYTNTLPQLFSRHDPMAQHYVFQFRCFEENHQEDLRKRLIPILDELTKRGF